jgi:outer membrane protein assembly factor BamB
MLVFRALVVSLSLALVGSLPAWAGEKPAASPASAGKLSPKVRLVANTTAGVTQANWPQFLGAGRDNRSPDKGLLATWPAEGPKLLNTFHGLGVGFSNMSFADGMLYTMGNQSEREYVIAINLESGETAWKFDSAEAYHNGFGDGPRGTPTIDGDRLYALGGTGVLTCLERKTGNQIWQKNIVKEFGSGVPGWGICESVLIDGERLICTPGAKNATLVALNKLNGEVVWKAEVPENDHTGYASMIPVEVGGLRQYVQFTAKGTIGIRAADGKFMWRDDSAANGTANCCAPVFADGMVFTASGYGKGGSMVQLATEGDTTHGTFAWHSNDMKVHHGGMFVVDGHVYGTNEGIPTCIELKTGTVKWQTRNSVGKGSVTWADGKLIIRSEGGPVALVACKPDAYEELGRFSQPDRSNRPAWTYPVITGGKLWLRDQDALLIYDLKGN